MQNKLAAPNAGIASRLTVGHHCPRIGEPGRSAANHSCYEKNSICQFIGGDFFSYCSKWLVAKVSSAWILRRRPLHLLRWEGRPLQTRHKHFRAGVSVSVPGVV